MSARERQQQWRHFGKGRLRLCFGFSNVPGWSSFIPNVSSNPINSFLMVRSCSPPRTAFCPPSSMVKMCPRSPRSEGRAAMKPTRPPSPPHAAEAAEEAAEEEEEEEDLRSFCFLDLCFFRLLDFLSFLSRLECFEGCGEVSRGGVRRDEGSAVSIHSCKAVIEEGEESWKAREEWWAVG